MRAPVFPAVLPSAVRTGPAAPAPATSDPEVSIDFEPVPLQRKRRSGWTPDRQRAFIAALARCGSVRAAARHVGLSATTVYRLLRMEGAESFAAAWDQAQDIGLARVQADALERSLHGVFVPVFRRGRLVRVEYRQCDRLAIAVLSGRDRDIANSGWAVRRAKAHADWKAHDERKAAAERAQAELAERHEEELKAMIERGRAARQPRIRML